MRQPDNLDMVQLMGWIERQPQGKTYAIVSETYGPLCGYVPHGPVGKEVKILDDGWFDPYRRKQ